MHEDFAKVAVRIGLGDVVYSCIKTIPSVVAPIGSSLLTWTFSVLKSDYMTQYLGVRHLMKINNNNDECPESKDIGTRSLSRQKVALIALITESFLVILSESWLLFGRVNNEPPMLKNLELHMVCHGDHDSCDVCDSKTIWSRFIFSLDFGMGGWAGLSCLKTPFNSQATRLF